MGPVARRCGAQVAAVKQLTGPPVAPFAVLSVGGNGADRRVRPRGPPSSASDSAVGRVWTSVQGLPVEAPGQGSPGAFPP